MTHLTTEKIQLRCAPLGAESCVPDILGQQNIQNRTKFDLSEYDEIYQAYGQRKSAYPYRQQDCYDRNLTPMDVDVIVLENQLARAEFLPGFGGRLWRLYDKLHGRDLLYTNDCLRPSNLAVRNAWFSGGVEWNCGVIGHTPLTMDRVFASTFRKDGIPVLRMYAYERIRSLVYQMDFWLDEETPALNCHMCVTNPNMEVVPMYWWSNIASPLHPGGRMLVPASKAFTSDHGTIVKQDIPHPQEGVDVSHCETVPNSRDFFFDIPRESPKWIANVDARGFGLLHISDERLRSRKLFVWGQKPGSHHWQQWLTDQGGDYLEIQAGLAKTQYGCLPMSPCTTWEWTERYAPVQLSSAQMAMDFAAASASLSAQILEENRIEAPAAFGHAMIHEQASVLFRGTGDGALENQARQSQGRKPLREHLDFGSDDRRQQPWADFLRTGRLDAPADFPGWDPFGPFWLEKLQAAKNKNWYHWYCIALLEKEAGRQDLALRAVHRSLRLEKTVCNHYALAVLELERNRKKAACQQILLALELNSRELSWVKAAMQLLLRCQAWALILEQWDKLPAALHENSRLKLLRTCALAEVGRKEEAAAILDDGLELADVREGELSVGTLWKQLHREQEELPFCFDFDVL